MENNQVKIIYIYDALCGWCYGFSPVIQKIYEENKDQIKFEVISGGMVKGERIGPIGEVAGYIKQAYKRVEDTCGVKFGEGFLNDILEEGTAIFTSIPAAAALSIFKLYQPESVIPFAAALQKAIYVDGIQPADFSAYAKYAEAFGIDPVKFTEQISSEEALKAAELDFTQTAAFGVNGFPTVIAQKDEKYYLLARGYRPYDDINESLQQLLNS